MIIPRLKRIAKRTLITINLAIGLLFLAGANTIHFDPVTFWILNLIALALPYLLLILVLFLVFWLITRPVWSLLSLACIIIGFQAVRQIIPPRLYASFHVNQNPGTIRVMSWNVEQFNIQNYKKHPERKKQMLDLINHYDPDIACLQEVVAGDEPSAINYLPDILGKLHFKDYFYSYKLSNDFDRDHHFGIAILSKYPIIKKQAMINNPNDYNSTFQFIDVLVGTDTVRVFNVHLQSLKFTRANLEYIDEGKVVTNVPTESKSIITKLKKGSLKRAVQARFIKDEMNHTHYPTILCGDFNDVPLSFAYETIGKNMKNAFVEKGAGISGTFSGISSTLRIDNIFTDTTFSILQYKRVKKLLSDHFPIVADIKIH